MNSNEVQQLIDSYGSAYDKLVKELHSFPKEMWQWKPTPEKWSIHEIIIHLADSEANSYVRARRFLAEPGSGVYGYDENKWASELNYHHQPTELALELFKLLRQTTYELIKNVSYEVWTTATIEHSGNGTMRFEQWLEIYEDHVPAHIRQMHRNLEAWKRSR